ncbi:hypothetical protein [Aquimarina sp. 2201CG14-23]|uniref:hypothetical protein n=1 Tax=Aquimarina mycalae TaxID=3040073 RepID=UPI00247827AC|nr:hypothetical protein [Aquimarina sp. 2201CG14-23]MDH7444442.1 hypothetical protein [Aquimarina sp. 2201CG14-23]
MKKLLLIFSLFCATVLFGNNWSDEDLIVSRNGDIITVVDFKDGDKVKLFELRTGKIITYKTKRGIFDLSQLPIGKYLLIDKKGRKVVVEKKFVDEEHYVK